MQVTINENDDAPIYQQIVNSVSRDILSGSMQAGYKLPTVRDLADTTGVSRGTVKHAYDQLEQLGLIEMTQGRGTFVCAQKGSGNASKKELAMQAIDHMLDDMLGLSFSVRDIRIFFDLKMREREELYPLVRIGAVDSSPEALSVIYNQISTFPNVEVYQFLLDDVLQHPEKLMADLDLIVAPATHYPGLTYKVPEHVPLMRMALSVSFATVTQLARLQPQQQVGVLTASNKYAGIILRGCGKYASLDSEPNVFLFGAHDGIDSFLAGQDVLLVPANYYKYCSKQEEEALSRWAAKGYPLICYEYHMDSGSFFYIGEQIEQIYASQQNTVPD